MSLSTIKKFNVVISLWLLAILITLALFGYHLDNFGCYIAAAVVGAIIVINNLSVIISGLIIPSRVQKRASREYN